MESFESRLVELAFPIAPSRYLGLVYHCRRARIPLPCVALPWYLPPLAVPTALVFAGEKVILP
jgi:hypothetical protein